MSLYVKYGSFAFEPWEAGLRVRAEFLRSGTMMKHIQAVRYEIEGELCEEGPTDVNTRLVNMIAAFSIDDQDCGLYFSSDNSPTTHYLATNRADNLTGNFVYDKNFPETKDGEFVSGRRFSLSVGAYLLNPEQELLEHEDSLDRTNNAGPNYTWERNRWWGYFPVLRSPNGMQQIVHRGKRVGATTWPLPVSPLYLPPFEDNTQRRIIHRAPQTYKKGYTGFTTEWQYVYTLPTFDDISRPSIGI